MTTDAMHTHKLTVQMHRDLVDALDYSLSPMDGLVAISQVYQGLPVLHASPLFQTETPKRLKVHYALLEWCGIGLSYVQLNDELHVLELWSDEDRKRCKRVKITITSDMFSDLEENGATEDGA